MGRRQWVVLVLLGATLTLTSNVSASGQKNWATAEAFIAKAKALSILVGAGSQPFHLEANFELRVPHHKPVNGTYTLDWFSADKWRKRVEAPNFAETQVGNNHDIWRSRTLTYEPLVAYIVPRAFGIHRTLELRPEYKVSRLRTRRDGSTCVYAHINRWTTEELCFDSASGALVKREYRSPFGVTSSVKLGDYRPFGTNLLFPWKISESEQGNIRFLLGIRALSPLAKADATLFLPTPGSEERPGCFRPSSPTPIRPPQPAYPESARLERLEGVVVAGVSIRADGSIQDVSVFESPSKDLAQATTNTIESLWSFKPAMCGNVSVPTDILVQTSFRLSQ